MSGAQNEFGPANRLSAGAVGAPGQRTFRLSVESDGGSAILWLEKEQLFQLGLAIRRLLVSIPEAEGPPQVTAPPSREALDMVSLDFKVERLALGHDASRGLFLIEAHDTESDPEGDATLRFWATRLQVEELAEEAFRVCAAGRPRCPLCSGPVDTTGHVCPRSNGHHSPSDL